MNNSVTYTKQEQFNRIKSIIENSNNTWNHVEAISNMINNYENIFGISKLSNSLQRQKLELYGRI